jgi:hypothetical protein
MFNCYQFKRQMGFDRGLIPQLCEAPAEFCLASNGIFISSSQYKKISKIYSWKILRVLYIFSNTIVMNGTVRDVCQAVPHFEINKFLYYKY